MAPDSSSSPAPASVRVPMIDAARLLTLDGARIIDLRSPSEYAEDHLPGAINLPLLSDAERAVVGLLYKRESPDRAFDQGLEFILETIEGLVAPIVERAGIELPEGQVRARTLELAGGGIEGLAEALAACEWVHGGEAAPTPLVLHCWRGGLRSQSVIALLGRLGVPEAIGLEGGYRAYRKQVMAELESWQAPPAWVLRGLTGVGKTLVLRELERIRPGSTIDLELAAGHRSSLLGMVGLEPVRQKAFDSRLATRLRGEVRGPVVYEGESRKVGDSIIPARLWESMQGAVNVLLTADHERREDVLLEDYLAREEDRPRLREQLGEVEKRIQPHAPLVELFDKGCERELVRVLLDTYYDPLYRHSDKGRVYTHTIDATDPAQAAQEVDRLLDAASAPS